MSGSGKGRISVCRGVIVTVLMLLFLLPAAAESEPLAVRVGVYENEPKVFIDDDGEPAGIFIDVIEDIAEREGWTLTYRSGSWSEGLVRLERGEIDLMPDAARSGEREKIFDYHDVPVLSDWFQVYAGKESGIRSIVDLNGKRVAILERSIQQEAFEKVLRDFDLECTLVVLPDYREMFSTVAAGDADAAVTNRFYGVIHAGPYNLEDTAVIFHPTRLFFAAPKDRNGRLLEAIDRNLKAMKKYPSSVYYQSLERWTSEKVRFDFPLWLKIAASVIILFLAIFIAVSIIFKRRISARTAELEDAYRASEERLIGAQQIARMGDFTWNLKTDEVSWSLGLYELLKVPPLEIPTVEMVFEEIHHPEDSELIRQWIDSAVGSGSGILDPVEYRIVCRGGEVKHVRAQGVIEHENGEPVRIFATIQDISDMKNVERELRELQEQLENQVEERTAELSDKVSRLDRSQKAMLYMVEDLNQITVELKEERSKLENANRELESFSYSVSHDLRAPLRAVEGFSRILEEDYGSVLDTEGRRILGIVRDNTKKMDVLISDLLELSRTGRTEIQLSTIDMTGMVHSMYHEVAPPDVVETFDLSVSALPEATADPTLMRRVWGNLLSNAIKYTKPCREKRIEISGRIEGTSCVYSIRDTGVGFNPEYREKLFTLFQRLHNADEFEGTGVGLAIVQRIIHRHGGEIWGDGAEGEGAVFYFSIPREKERKGSGR